MYVHLRVHCGNWHILRPTCWWTLISQKPGGAEEGAAPSPSHCSHTAASWVVWRGKRPPWAHQTCNITTVLSDEHFIASWNFNAAHMQFHTPTCIIQTAMERVQPLFMYSTCLCRRVKQIQWAWWCNLSFIIQSVARMELSWVLGWNGDKRNCLVPPR